MNMKIAIANDRAGLELKNFLIGHLSGKEKPIAFLNLGIDREEAVDYPDQAKMVVNYILSGKADLGVLICGTGIGMSIAANRFRGIRAAICHHPLEARLAREHNDANILCLGARMIGAECALENLCVFLDTKFTGGRHSGRINKLDLLTSETLQPPE
jgi:ribose 5-phosphate isomerase B